MTERILVVDDEQNIRRSLEITLEGEGFAVESAGTGEEALAAVAADPPDAVFLDIKLPGLDGMEVLRRLRAEHPRLPVVMITGHATIARAVEATRLGAFDFVEKPFSSERILLLARNAAQVGWLKRENAFLRETDGEEILGHSPAIQELRRAIASIAPTDTRVLILGESGTGKELVAQALHRLGPRGTKAYVRVNCAAIPDDLIEAELFGAAKGAYTGAVSARRGRFAAADGGTLFLDEVGDMSLRAQAKVLRVLQEGEFELVGSTQTVKVDVRILAATHQDLAANVRAGSFREDLFHRLNVIPLRVPPLRERAGDVRLLGEHFLGVYARRHELPAPRLSVEAWKHLESYGWAGNIRELKNVIERLVILRRGAVIGPGDLPVEIVRAAGGGGAASEVTPPGEGTAPFEGAVPGEDPAPCGGTAPCEDAAGGGGDEQPDGEPRSWREARDAYERAFIRAALARHGGKIARAAEELGFERTHLHKRIRELG
jgi:two-component system nitrogen regulation response regulator NtrX